MQRRTDEKDNHQPRHEAEDDGHPLAVREGSGADGLCRALDWDEQPREHVGRDAEPAHQAEEHEDDADDRHVPAEAGGDASGNAADDPVVPAPVETPSSEMVPVSPPGARVFAMWAPTRASCFPPRWP